MAQNTPTPIASCFWTSAVEAGKEARIITSCFQAVLAESHRRLDSQSIFLSDVSGTEDLSPLTHSQKRQMGLVSLSSSLHTNKPFKPSLSSLHSLIFATVTNTSMIALSMSPWFLVPFLLPKTRIGFDKRYYKREMESKQLEIKPAGFVCVCSSSTMQIAQNYFKFDQKQSQAVSGMSDCKVFCQIWLHVCSRRQLEARTCNIVDVLGF